MDIFSQIFPFRKSLLCRRKLGVMLFFNILVCLCAFRTGRTCQCTFAFVWQPSSSWSVNAAGAFHFLNIFFGSIEHTTTQLDRNLVATSNASQSCSGVACWFWFLLKLCWITLQSGGGTVCCTTCCFPYCHALLATTWGLWGSSGL